ncbi:unnamed protein product [Rotaria magnacalcarata]|uniref:Poly [ADP-ribose] polymerase n=1 Tax=Rotaria magnacalcarata TaxID=392030 RepID=A0A816M200_9BILA|nr:unnamed protein product [Rotaria magnacalcarata]CAF3823051.1 unnamed protein product [Rotaria magnacalcarata]
MSVSATLLSPFNGKTIVLELGREIGFKAKQDLINYLREQQAHISYILTASTDYILVTNNFDSYKVRRAKQLGLPLVNVEYVYECRRLQAGQTPIDISKFIVKSVEDQENFTKTGTISVAGSQATCIKANRFDLNKIKLWNADDVDLPRFDESTHCEIAKWAIFKETNDNSEVFFVLELQVIPEQYFDRTMTDYRLRFRYEKQTIVRQGQKQDNRVLIQYAFGDEPNEQQQLFASYYYRIAKMPRVTRIREMLPDKLGSKLLLRSLFANRIDTQILDDNVCQLIESIWLESIGDLNKILSVLPESITLKTIIEAEAVLLELKSTNDPAAALRFYSLIPHRAEYKVDLVKNRRALTEKIDLCQLLRDMLTVNELTNWNTKAPIEAKYRALNCHIEIVDSSTPEFMNVAEHIQSSTDNGEKIVIHQIFSVAKQTDALNFRTSLSNQQQLFHGSKYANFLGILSRGLAMPKMVVEELGVVRTDIGCLGYGIYFSDSVSTSLKYTTASTTRPGRRLLCVCQVALGESANYYSFSPTITKPPDGFHSTHGVKRTEENRSMFSDNEYAIYQLDQQRLLYIVEVSWIPNDNINIALERLPVVHHEQHALKLSEHVEVPLTIDDEIIEVAEQDYGLVCPSSGKLVPLKSFHIRAQIVDATVEVVLYQVYHNTSSIPIEAKYVFPLDENSTVCGFEAHINNKIIKGVVKEKEQAKQEYREAIEKGHGAYLMHQEQAQVFSVAVGNLPANNEVIIKITYVAELEIENGDIIFRLPAKMASWQSKQAIETKDQSTVRSIDIVDEKVEFSFKTSIRMPYEIIKLFSPTHRLRRKLTDCMAMVELVDNVLLDRDFVLSVTLKSANLPRISNETWTLDDDNGTTTSNNRDSEACLLTFYPRFETLSMSNETVEIIFIVDVSNSMDGSHVQQAKQLAHLFLTHLKVDNKNTYFNVVTFGSDNDECFPISTLTTKENLDKAKHFVLHSLIHRGNTDLLAVLHRYSLLPSVSSSKSGRQFILLSDGHIHDVNSIIALLEHRSTMRCDRLFACSIGNVANKHGLKQLTRGIRGGGLVTIFDSNYRSKWKTKVLEILEHTRQPCVTSISIDWHGGLDEGQKFNMQAPKMIRSLFDGMRLSVYRFIHNCHKATLTATIDGQEFVTTVFSSPMTTTRGRILHCLTARAIIDDYENGILHEDESENELIKIQCKQDLIDLSINYSVVSPYTSFVAIEERDAKTDQSTLQPGVRLIDVMLDRDVDILPYIEWDGDKSNLALIKQKLIDGRISLESASILGKKESVVDIEKLCKKISYRAGGDAKFDMMMSIIRTYRHSLNEHDKANELEDKMRNDIKNEMLSATTEERQALEQRCAANNLRITTNEEMKEFLEDDDLNLLECSQSIARLKQLALNMSDSIVEQNQCIDRIELSSSQKDKKSRIDIESMRIPILTSSIELPSKSIALEDEGEDMGFSLFDDGGASYSRCENIPSVEVPSGSQQLQSTESDVDLYSGFDFSMLDTMDESSYINFTKNLEMKISSKKSSDLKPEPLEKYRKSDSMRGKSTMDATGGGGDFGTARFTDTRMSPPTSYPIPNSKINKKLKQNLKEIPQKEMNEKRTGRSLQSFAAPSTMPLQPRRGASDMLMSNFYRISEPLERCQSSSKSAMSTPLYHMSHTSTTTTVPLLPSSSESWQASQPPPPPAPPMPMSMKMSSSAAPPMALSMSPLLLPPPPPPMALSMRMSPPQLLPQQRQQQQQQGYRQQSAKVRSPLRGRGLISSIFSSRASSMDTSKPYSDMAAPGTSEQLQNMFMNANASNLRKDAADQIINNTNNNNATFLNMASQMNSQSAAGISPISSSGLDYFKNLFSPSFSSSSSKQASVAVCDSSSSSGYYMQAAQVLQPKAPMSTLSDTSCKRMNTSMKQAFKVAERGFDESDMQNAESESTDLHMMSRKKKKQRRTATKAEVTSQASIHDLLLLDVCALGLGVEDTHGRMHILIRRNTTIPTRTQFYSIFTNAYAYQTTASIRVFEGEHNLTKYNLLLGELCLSGLTRNFAAQTLEIAIRMEIDANGIIRVDAEEARSGAKASISINPGDVARSSVDDIERHIAYVQSDADFQAKSVYDRKPEDPLYTLDGQTETVIHNFSGELATTLGKTIDDTLLGKLKDVQSTKTMIEAIMQLQYEDGSFILNKQLADVLHIDCEIFNRLEHYLREQGFNSLALNVRNELLRLIGTGVILLWLFLKTQSLQQNMFEMLTSIEQIKINLCNCLPANMNGKIKQAIEFYQQACQRNGIYCRQLELRDSSWHPFIQHLLVGIDRTNL